MPPTLRFLSDLPIARKLLLASITPIIAVIVLSTVTYQSVQTFSDDEEQLNNIYLAQRTAAEYLRLALDLQSGFRGYVLTRKDSYLNPYLMAHDRILTVGDRLEHLARDRDAQQTIRETQLLLKRLINDTDRMIGKLKAGHSTEALYYIEQGHGRAIMLLVREQMVRFDRLEQDVLNEAFAKISQDRSSMIAVILGGGILAFVLMVLTLRLIARSITDPLAGLARAVGSASGGSVPQVPALERRDEIGALTRVMGAMSAQIREHITRMEKSEAELRLLNRDLSASESKYRSIVDHVPLGIFTTRGMELVFSNRYNYVLAGLNPDDDHDPEVIRQAYHPEDRNRVLSEFAEAVKGDRPCETVFRFLRKDGTIRKVLSRRVPIRDENGKTVMYQGFNIDITALDQMQERLRRSERLATLGQVAAGIAHEIRNPLVGIGSTAVLLLEETGQTDPRRAELEVVLRETKRLDRIVNQIIDYARPRALAPVVFPLEALTRETLALLDGALKSKRIRVECQFHPTLAAVQADRDQIKQVLLNVLQNGIEAMDHEGTLRIEALDYPHEREPGILLKMTDDGAGIPPADLPHVFDPFFTTGKRHGTGLGLAICLNIIEAHQGDIRLESPPGKGTTVRIWLPLRQPPPVALA